MIVVSATKKTEGERNKKQGERSGFNFRYGGRNWIIEKMIFNTDLKQMKE